MDRVAADTLIRPTAGENEAIIYAHRATLGIRIILHLPKHCERFIRQRHDEIFVFDLHSLRWNRPKLFVVVDLGKPRAPALDKLNVSRSEIPAVTHVDYSARIQ